MGSRPKPVKLAEEVLDLYGEDVPKYVQELISPMRDRYLNTKTRQAEMLTTLTKVTEWP